MASVHSSKRSVVGWLVFGAVGALTYVFLRDELLLALPSDQLQTLHLLSAVITLVGVGVFFTVRHSRESRAWPVRKRVAFGVVLVGFIGFALFGPGENCAEASATTASSCEALTAWR